jgi:putative Ca2+/H+ antiporter (TMEM165/GDT1 family)
MMDWNAFLSAFGLVFVAELGDKTQLAVIAQVCKYRRPWSVFAGGSLALTVVTALGAVGGQVLREFVPAPVIRGVAAIAFVAMGVIIGLETLRSRRGTFEEACACVEATGMREPTWDWKAFGATCALLLVAELGDKTQLAVLGLAGQTAAFWMVFAGAALALVAVTGLSVMGGRRLCEWLPQELLLRISAVAFGVMGLLMALGVL